MVNHNSSVEIAGDWLRQEMKKANDQKGLEILEEINNLAYYYSDYRELTEWLSYGGNYDKSFLDLALIAFKSPEYNFVNYFHLLNGMNRGGAPLNEKGIMTNLTMN